MSKEVIEKAVVSAVLVVFYLFLPTFGYGGWPQHCCGIEGHLLYSFCHGNVWHLVGNIACIWAIMGRFWWGVDYLIAVAVSFLPSLCAMSVCGASCVVFAEVGRRFGGVSVRVAAIESPDNERRNCEKTHGTAAGTGVMDGRTMKTAVKAMVRMAKCVWPAFVIGAVVPGIAVMPHLWALMGGFFAVFVGKSVMRMAKNGGKTGKTARETGEVLGKMQERRRKWLEK